MSSKQTKNDKAGQPTKYTVETGDRICVEITMGKSLSKISKENDFCLASVFNWLRTNKEFLDNYTRAKEEQADFFAEEIMEIADEVITPLMDGKIDGGVVNHRRLRVDARKWVASKLKPKKYGDKLQTEELNKVEPVAVNITLTKDKTEPA